MRTLADQPAFLDDLQLRQGTMHVALIGSPIANGYLQGMDTTFAESMPGVSAIITAANIPGANLLVSAYEDRPLLADGPLRFHGQPIGLVIASSPERARAAAAAVIVHTVEVAPVTTVREAFGMGQLLAPARTIQNGFPHRRWKRAEHLFEDSITMGAQEHGYAEPQGAIAMPDDEQGLHIFAATQTPASVQQSVAAMLGKPLNRIKVETVQLGGSFGGKSEQAVIWAALAALAASIVNAPVKFILNRQEDLCLTGKKPACIADFQIALSEHLRIEAYKVTFYLNAGAYADLVPSLAEDVLLHLNGPYDIPNILGSIFCCRTNLPPNTQFRAGGAAMAAFALEAAITKAAETLKIPAYEIQRRNLITLNEYFPFGQQATRCTLPQTWNEVISRNHFKQLQLEVRQFNQENKFRKRGLVALPICCGIPYTHARSTRSAAGVHIYPDGSIAIRTCTVDTGMGEHKKLKMTVAKLLQTTTEHIHILPVNTAYQPDLATNPLPPSTELSAKALASACVSLRDTLRKTAATILKDVEPAQIAFDRGQVTLDGKRTSLSLAEVAKTCYSRGLKLSELVTVQMPGVNYDARGEHGHPFAYHVYGSAVCMVTLDTRNGTHQIDHLNVVHDSGTSLCEPLDRTIIESGILMGMGWMTSESIAYTTRGVPKIKNLFTANFPSWDTLPLDCSVQFLDTKAEPLGLEGSKTPDDPPLIYGLAVFFAIRQALLEAGVRITPSFTSPMLPTDVLISLQDAI